MNSQLYQPTNIEVSELTDDKYQLSFEMEIPQQEGVEEIGSWPKDDLLNAVFNAVGDGDESGPTRIVSVVSAPFDRAGTNELLIAVAKKGKIQTTTMATYG